VVGGSLQVGGGLRLNEVSKGEEVGSDEMW
jgi:hypothetical protein